MRCRFRRKAQVWGRRCSRPAGRLRRRYPFAPKAVVRAADGWLLLFHELSEKAGSKSALPHAQTGIRAALCAYAISGAEGRTKGDGRSHGPPLEHAHDGTTSRGPLGRREWTLQPALKRIRPIPWKVRRNRHWLRRAPPLRRARNRLLSRVRRLVARSRAVGYANEARRAQIRDLGRHSKGSGWSHADHQSSRGTH